MRTTLRGWCATVHTVKAWTTPRTFGIPAARPSCDPSQRASHSPLWRMTNDYGSKTATSASGNTGVSQVWYHNDSLRISVLTGMPMGIPPLGNGANQGLSGGLLLSYTSTSAPSVTTFRARGFSGLSAIPSK